MEPFLLPHKFSCEEFGPKSFSFPHFQYVLFLRFLTTSRSPFWLFSSSSLPRYPLPLVAWHSPHLLSPQGSFPLPVTDAPTCNPPRGSTHHTCSANQAV